MNSLPYRMIEHDTYTYHIFSDITAMSQNSRNYSLKLSSNMDIIHGQQ